MSWKKVSWNLGAAAAQSMLGEVAQEGGGASQCWEEAPDTSCLEG